MQMLFSFTKPHPLTLTCELSSSSTANDHSLGDAYARNRHYGPRWRRFLRSNRLAFRVSQRWIFINSLRLPKFFNFIFMIPPNHCHRSWAIKPLRLQPRWQPESSWWVDERERVGIRTSLASVWNMTEQSTWNVATACWCSSFHCHLDIERANECSNDWWNSWQPLDSLPYCFKPALQYGYKKCL